VDRNKQNAVQVKANGGQHPMKSGTSWRTKAKKRNDADSRISATLRLARRKEAEEISQATAADKKTAAVGLITDHFCNPAYCLPFNFARYGPGATRPHSD
jgi:hypothetical protein